MNNNNRESVTRDVLTLVYRGVFRVMNIFNPNPIPSTNTSATTSSPSASASGSSISSFHRLGRLNLFWRSSSSLAREDALTNPGTTSTNPIIAAGQRFGRQTRTWTKKIVRHPRTKLAVGTIRRGLGLAAGNESRRGRRRRRGRRQPSVDAQLEAVESDCGGRGFLGFAGEGEEEEEVEEGDDGDEEFGSGQYFGEEQAEYDAEMELEMREENRVCDKVGELFDLAPTLGRRLEE